VSSYGFPKRWWWSSRHLSGSGLKRRSKTSQNFIQAIVWYLVRVSKCASPHNADVLALGQTCSTSACRWNRTRYFPHLLFRLVPRNGVKNNLKFKVTLVTLVAPSLPVFQWPPHQHLQIDQTAPGEDWSECWPQEEGFAPHFKSYKHRDQLLDWATEVQWGTLFVVALQFTHNFTLTNQRIIIF
jgi:hypothetical protein